MVAATATAVSDKFGKFSQIGGIIGTSVSAGFLLLLALMNIYILYKLVQQIRKLIATPSNGRDVFEIKGGGCLFWLFRKAFTLIDRYALPFSVAGIPAHILQTVEDVSTGSDVWTRLRYLVRDSAAGDCVGSSIQRHKHLADPDFPSPVHR